MSVVVILILASLAVALLFLAAFIWSVCSGQYDDTLTPSMRMLLDEPVAVKATNPLPETGSNAVPLPVSATTKRGGETTKQE